MDMLDKSAVYSKDSRGAQQKVLVVVLPPDQPQLCSIVILFEPSRQKQVSVGFSVPLPMSRVPVAHKDQLASHLA